MTLFFYFDMQNRHADPLSMLAYDFMFDREGLPARLDKITADDAAPGQVRRKEKLVFADHKVYYKCD